MVAADARIWRSGLTPMIAVPATDTVRDAATVILWRTGCQGPEVLMGQRGARAAFMPGKVVFPGGAVDPADADVPLLGAPDPLCLHRLSIKAAAGIGHALLAAAIREVWEETGLVLGAPGAWLDAPPDWQAFAATGNRPSAAGFRFAFRAVTPPGRTRRFDARFFLVHAGAVRGDADDFSRASDELSLLQWIPLSLTRGFDLPFVTTVVLAEVGPHLDRDGPPPSVPFVVNDDMVSQVTRL